MKAITSTALALLLGPSLALPVVAAQDGVDADANRRIATEGATARDGRLAQESAGGEEEVARGPSSGATAEAEAAGGAIAVQAGPAGALELAQADAGGEARPVTAEAAGVRDNALELALTEDTLRGSYITDGPGFGAGGTDLALSVLLSEDRDIVGSAAVVVPGMLGNMLPGALSLFFGGTAYAALLDEPDDDVFGLAPGVGARLALPVLFDTPSYILSYVFYAPDILTFGDAENLVDFGVRYEVEFTDRVVGFVGYHLLDFEQDEDADEGGGGGDSVVDDLQLGLRFTF